MPFKSSKQRRFVFAQHPEIAKKWAQERSSTTPKQITAPNPSPAEASNMSAEPKYKKPKFPKIKNYFK